MTSDGRVVHGGPDLAELRAFGLTPADVLDFSASITPLGTPPEVRAAIAAVDPAAYPDRECSAFRATLALTLGVRPEDILAGNGSTELLHLAARAFLKPAQAAFVFSPTFGEYEAAAIAQGADIVEAKVGGGLRWDLGATAAEIVRLKPALTFLCNPNNPTGVMLEPAEVQTIARAAHPGYLVVDEAYMPLADDPWDSLALLAEGNVILVRSMTKEYGLAGVRLGYLLAPPDLLYRMKRLQPTWTVNALAQAAGVAALECQEHVERGRDVIARGKRYLMRDLAALGLKPLPSPANFFLVEVGDAATLRERLLRHRVLVRNCASFGLPRYIRVSVRAEADCAILVRALKDVLGSSESRQALG